LRVLFRIGEHLRRKQVPDELALTQHAEQATVLVDHGQCTEPGGDQLASGIAEQKIRLCRPGPLGHDVSHRELPRQLILGEHPEGDEVVIGRCRQDVGHRAVAR
jgi:hypothetical protein